MALTKGIRAAAIEEDGCSLGLNHLILNRKDRDLINENREGFERMANLLLEKEVIFAEDIEKILGPKSKPAGSESDATDNTTTATTPSADA